jgi:hypothetical protein
MANFPRRAPQPPPRHSQTLPFSSFAFPMYYTRLYSMLTVHGLDGQHNMLLFFLFGLGALRHGLTKVSPKKLVKILYELCTFLFSLVFLSLDWWKIYIWLGTSYYIKNAGKYTQISKILLWNLNYFPEFVTLLSKNLSSIFISLYYFELFASRKKCSIKTNQPTKLSN